MTTSSAWIQTAGGKQFFPLDPDPSQLDIRDIAHALSNLCRYTGHVNRFLSVGEHSVRVANYMLGIQPENKTKQGDSQARLEACYGLMHDASEAYLQDLPRPLTEQPEFAFYRKAEAKLQSMIYKWCGLGEEEPAAVHLADMTMLSTERVALLGPSPAPWCVLPPPLANYQNGGGSNFGWDPGCAETNFLRTFEVLFHPAGYRP